MVLRTAKTGRNAGSQFWGCSTFPRCRGIRDVEAEAEAEVAVPQPLPVAWNEGAFRSEFIPEYVSVGAMPGVLRDRVGEHAVLEQALTQCVLLSRRVRSRNDASEHAKLASALLAKILQRGRVPLPSLGLERAALRQHGLLQQARDLAVDGIEMGWELLPGPPVHVSGDGLLAVLAERCEFSLDPDFSPEARSEPLLQSPEESWFLERWVPDILGPSAAHWFTPQASLDTLLESGGIDEAGARRIDFLFHYPGSSPIGIEIDGEEHDSAAAVDDARDQSLAKLGIDVLRITHHEVRQGGGVVLGRLRDRCETSLSSLNHSKSDHSIARFVLDCSNAAKVQFAIARAIGWGWLTADQQWTVNLCGGGRAAATGVLDILQLLSGLDALYGDISVPKCCTVCGDDKLIVAWAINDNGHWEEVTPPDPDGECVRLVVESHTSPYHRLGADLRADLIVRPAFIPVDFAADPAPNSVRQPISPLTYEKAHPALTQFLRTVFRKCHFRPMQGEAVYNALRQHDCVVLLPTGAGKSLIYQLAGLLMPGVTIVVDPIVALIEDQVEGLRSYGIDRAAPIARNLSSPQNRKRLLLRIERGDYFFVLLAPERLQSPQFRSTLRALTELTVVNLAVIDEAHCVSEWGHDFRPAYLHLGNNLRLFGTTHVGKPPPILALTGTASRAVLRDMLIDLGIDRNRSDALIRPESFDRSELNFEVARTRPPEDPNASLRGVLNSLPTKFGLPRTELYRPSGQHTASGIVFVPTVNARAYGLIDARKTVRDATNAGVAIYSGSPPRGIDSTRWEGEKRTNARSFKRNQIPILVATKAFGMGIDKPNIRYTVHFGMPGSLESFYQEAGRAGRDRKPARCVIVFSEYDESRSDALLDPDLNLPSLRERFAVVGRDKTTGDDITRALWFHLEGFHGADDEVEEVKQLLHEIGPLSSHVRKTFVIPFDRDSENKKDDSATDKSREKALCRLMRIGVISDYQVDFGAKKFTGSVDPFDFGRCKERLLEYVSAAQPAKGKLLARQLDGIDPTDHQHAAHDLARHLIEFIYDVIERSRRRMIQESVLLARRANSDEDIRTRLLNYLQEGLGAEQISHLLDQPEVSLADWLELVDKCQTPADAGELRGLCIRALETYPDHPGLLLARSASEAMCSDHDEGVSSQGMAAAIRGSILDYEVASADVHKTVEALFDLALVRARELGVSLIIALLGLDDSNSNLTLAVRCGLARAEQFDDDRVRTAVATQRMRGMVGTLESAILRLARQYNTSSVLEALRG